MITFRYGWTHSIPARKFDVVPDEKVGGLTAIRRGKRLSLTFRTVRKSLICDCGYVCLMIVNAEGTHLRFKYSHCEKG
jgi:hypothetical protein